MESYTTIKEPRKTYVTTSESVYEVLIFSEYEDYYYALHDVKYEDFIVFKGIPYALARVLCHL